jgi:hypothetical protein
MERAVIVILPNFLAVVLMSTPTRRIRSGCARVTTGHAAAPPSVAERR